MHSLEKSCLTHSLLTLLMCSFWLKGDDTASSIPVDKMVMWIEECKLLLKNLYSLIECLMLM